jgi:hypothetical protein
MKSKPLLDIVSLPIHHKTIAIGNKGYTITLKNNFCHILFSDRQGLQGFLKTLDHCRCLVVECFQNFTTILDELHHLNSKTVLETLIISNLSLIYWELKSITQENYQCFDMKSYSTPIEMYRNLGEVITSIKRLYRCNIIVISYDITFAQGYNYKTYPKKWDNSYSLSSLTDLPPPYLIKTDQLVHVDDKSNIRVFDKVSQLWKEPIQ